MTATKGLSKRYQDVTIGLMSGETLNGYLLGFSPIMTKLYFHDRALPEDAPSVKLDVQDIIYIGMYPSSGCIPEHPSKLQHMDELKIITVNAESFEVLASPSMSNTPGFFAVSKDSNSPFERIFFYHHGIRYQEKPERLGDLLVDQEMLSPDDIHQALKKQASSVVPFGRILRDQGKVDDADITMVMERQNLQRMKLGDVLVNQEVVSSEDVEQALEKQAESKDKPLGHILLEHGKVQETDIHSALEIQKRRKMRLGDLLVEAGLITEEDVQYALEAQKERGQRLGEILLSSEIITEEQLLTVLAQKFRLPTVDLDDYDIDPLASTEVEREVIEKYGILPIQTDKHKLTVALADPLGLEAYDSICFHTGKKVHEVMCKASQLKFHINKYLQDEEQEEELSCEFLQQSVAETEDDSISELEMAQSAEDAPIVRLVNRIIRNGLIKKASDIHILPQAKKIILAYRLNGDLISENALDKGLHKQIIARIKILAGMDITEQRLPQDGRLILRDGKKIYEFRISCIPNSFGESLVLRILNKEAAVNLKQLGLRQDDYAQISAMTRKPYGLILVTGPTGSGKSTSLFAMLQSISHLPAHILTIEDPVESDIDGANQIQVNQKIGLTFARILRNVLRHDPDIIMIGEMRDQETAEIGIEAALTGHLLFSTLHTNSAVDTIIRLNDFGIPNYLLASALLGIISQNLIKKLCPDCHVQLAESADSFEIIHDLGYETPARLYAAKGCEQCDQSGYVGRVMVYEVLSVNETIRHAIHDGKLGRNLQKIAVENGMIPKAMHALQLAEDGVIDHNDLIRSLM